MCEADYKVGCERPQKGRRRFDSPDRPSLSSALLCGAVLGFSGGDQPLSSTTDLFVYGRLLEGGLLASLMRRGDVRLRGPARCRGALYDLGECPGLITGGRLWIAGELYRIESPDSFFLVLDDMVGEAGFERCLTEVSWRHGPQQAWAYHYTGPVDRATRIPGGSWRAHLRALKRKAGGAGAE